MPRLSLWNSGIKGNNFKFIDRKISEFFGVSGTAVYVHKYIGTYGLDSNGQPTVVPPTTIQDVLYLENRDRAYDKFIYELRGCYNVTDNDVDLKQFGFFLTGDTVFLEVHMNDMINLVGRRINPGDVIELPHQRDETSYDLSTPMVNKFLVVQEATRASDGYSSTWYPHIWRLKLIPMTDSQEYQDILNQQAQNPLGMDQGTLGSIISNIGNELGINEDIIDQAIADVKKRNFETQQFWVLDDDESTNQAPWIYAGDGIPPNGAVATGSGTSFPIGPTEGQYFLRTDYEPRALFKFGSSTWTLLEQDYRMNEWSAAHRILKSFINNDTITTMKDGTTFSEKTPLWKSVTPKADF